MKRNVCLITCLYLTACLLSLPALAIADDQIAPLQTRHARQYDDAQLAIASVFVCDANAVPPCETPTRLIYGKPRFTIEFWSPMTQDYYRHYVVTDSAGTVVYYNLFSGSLPGDSIQKTWLDIVLPDGDYTFTAVIAGGVSGMAVTDQLRFSVR